MPGIESARPLPGCRLKVAFDNGCDMTIDLSAKARTTRFRQLAEPGVFAAVRTDGERVYWNELTELSISELFELAETDAAKGCGRPVVGGETRGSLPK